MRHSDSNTQELTRVLKWTTAIALPLVIALMAGCPVYNVWTQGLAGKAALAKAEQTRQIMVAAARAEQDAAAYRAKAIEILGAVAQKYPEYRQQLFIESFGNALEAGAIEQVFYVPTEGNIPILEAGRATR